MAATLKTGLEARLAASRTAGAPVAGPARVRLLATSGGRLVVRA